MKLTAKSLGALLVLVVLTGLVFAGCAPGATSSPTTGSSGTAATPATTSGTSAVTIPSTSATVAGSTTGSTGAVVEARVAAVVPFTGPRPSIALEALNATQMAIDEFNAAQDTIHVAKVEVGDDAADATKAAAVAEKLAADPAIVGVIGPMTGASVRAALPALEKGSLPLIAPSATDDSLSQGGYKVFHRVCPVDSAQDEAVAGIMAGYLKAKKVFILADRGTYGQGLADRVEEILKQRYGVAEIQRAQVEAGDKDYTVLIDKVRSYGPDVFFAAIPGPAAYADIAKQMQAQSYKVQLVGADSVKDKGEFIDNADGATEGTLFASLGPILESPPDPKVQDFVKKYTDEYQVVSMFSAQSYEATNVLLDAIVRNFAASGKVTREGVLEALKTTNYRGVLGIPISFNEDGDLKTSGVFIGQVRNGRFVQVKAADY